jgi:pimeloyl-ACP methyl ester carboxylesterase
VDTRGSGSRLLDFPAARRRRAVRTAFRSFFGFVSRLSPRIGAVPAEILFLSPPAQRRTRAEAAVLAAGESFRVRTPLGRLAAWSWGSGPRVLLVHGWGGHAGRLSRFVPPLVAAGFSVVAFDAPAHGESSGRRSSLPDFVEAILAVAAARGPVTAVIAHSMGATACALALGRGLGAERAVLIAPPADPERYVGKFARFFGIPDHTRDSLKVRLAARYRTRWEDLRADRPAEGARCRLLVVHDARDSAVPVGDGMAVVDGWDDALLVRTSGLGHHKILREPGVVSEALRFLADTRTRRDVPATGA